mmetsp:Transcript_20085/g.63018  ORF Transcript_20085/g.63018 Transcript_20085/m.63018 type:complete len:99 (+) Transcript_20085:31-327(+)
MFTATVHKKVLKLAPQAGGPLTHVSLLRALSPSYPTLLPAARRQFTISARPELALRYMVSIARTDCSPTHASAPFRYGWPMQAFTKDCSDSGPVPSAS